MKELKTDSVYLAFLDILGFKELIEKNTSEEIEGLFMRLVPFITTSGLSQGKTREWKENGQGYFANDLSDNNINALIISDSIILWTKDSTMKSFFELILALTTIMWNGIFTGLPLRGAVTVGSLFTKQLVYPGNNADVSGQIILGKALAKSYSYSQMHNWHGCVIHPECINHYNQLYSQHPNRTDLVSIQNLIEFGLLGIYKTPLKNGRKKKEYVLRWVSPVTKKMHKDHIKFSFSMHKKNISSKDVKRKIKNTQEFLKFYNQLSVSKGSIYENWLKELSPHTETNLDVLIKKVKAKFRFLKK